MATFRPVLDWLGKGPSADERRAEIEASLVELVSVEPETLRLYYERQHQRLEQLEGERLAFTNIVLAASAVAIAVILRTGGDLSSLQRAGAVSALVSANLVAIFFNVKRQHQIMLLWERVAVILAALDCSLAAFDRGSFSRDPFYVRSSTYMVGLHAVFCVVGVLALV